MLALKLRVRDPSGEANPSLGAAVTRNLPQVLVSFSDYSGNEGIDALLSIVTLVVYVAIGITISSSPTRQGFHDRLAGGTYVVRPTVQQGLRRTPTSITISRRQLVLPRTPRLEKEARDARCGLWGPPCYGNTESVPALGSNRSRGESVMGR